MGALAHSLDRLDPHGGSGRLCQLAGIHTRGDARAASADARPGARSNRQSHLSGQLCGLSWRERGGRRELGHTWPGRTVSSSAPRRPRPHLASLRPSVVRDDLCRDGRPAPARLTIADASLARQIERRRNSGCDRILQKPVDRRKSALATGANTQRFCPNTNALALRAKHNLSES